METESLPKQTLNVFLKKAFSESLQKTTKANVIWIYENLRETDTENRQTNQILMHVAWKL